MADTGADGGGTGGGGTDGGGTGGGGTGGGATGGGGTGGIDAELEGLVLDEEFVRHAPVVELRAHERVAVRAAAAAERAQRERRALSVPARPDRPSRRRRPPKKLVVGVVAVLAFAGVMATLKAMGVNQGGPTTSDAATGAAIADTTYVAGDCVTWPDSEGEFATRIGIEVVPCEEPHRFEMLGTIELDDGAFPTPTQFAQLFGERCPPLVRARLGRDLDPAGRFTIAGFEPTVDGWRGGDRGLACAIAVRGRTANGDNVLFTGAAAAG